MHHLKKISLVYLLITYSAIFPQDSTNSIQNLFNFSTVSTANTVDNSPLTIQNELITAPGKSKLGIASQPIFINSERPMIDGTSWMKYSDVDYLRLSSMLGAIGVVNAVAYTYQRNVWYTEETTVFHSLDFSEDWGKYQQMDKFGHFSDAYFTSDLTGKLYRWSGISGETSVWLGALTGWLWMLEIEVSDAFMAEWGFSWGDMLANTAGSAFYILQQFNYDALGGIHPKFSWHKSTAWENNWYTRDP